MVAIFLTAGGILLFHRGSLSFLFSSEDWTVVGPPAVKRFLDDPFSLLGFLAGGHYNPLGRLFFTLESLLFGAHPAGYHLVSLALLCGLSLLLLRFLLVFGAGFPASLLAALCFAANWINIHLVLQVYNQHYFLLGLLLLASLLRFRAFLAEGRRSDLALAALLVLGAQYVHSTAVVFPLLLALLLPFEWRTGEGEDRRKKGSRALLLIGGAVVVLQALPRLLLGLHLEGIGAFPSLNLPGFLKTLSLLPGIAVLPLREGMDPTAVWGLAALVIVSVGAWVRRPRLFPLLLLGGATLVLTLAPAFFILNWRPEFFASRFRYVHLPSLGAAVVLGVLLDALWRAGKRWAGWGAKAAAAALAVLFLAGSLYANTFFYWLFGEQARFVESVAASYRATATRLLAESPCERIVVRDIPVESTAPRELLGGLLLQGLNHQRIHGFYFALDRPMMARFEFVETPPGGPPRAGPCEVTLVNGVPAPPRVPP